MYIYIYPKSRLTNAARMVGLCRLIRRDASGLIEYDLDKMGDILIDSPVFIGSPYPVYIHI